MGTDHGYSDLAPVGSGPSATVYSGLHTSTGNAVALKVFDAKLSRRVHNEAERELAKLAPLRGAASVLVADGVEDFGDRTALRMELCTQSLPDLIADSGPLSTSDAVALGRALAGALAAAHAAGLVHGAVTPGNVLFRPSGEPVLADFGLVLRRELPRDPRHAIGFMPPETLRNGTADERSDLYGLGAVLHFALSGTEPHPARLGELPDARELRVLGDEPVPPLTTVPKELADVVSALLAKDPLLRPDNAAEVAARLAGLATPEPAEDDFDAPPRPQGEPVFVSAPKPPKERHFWPVLAGAAGLLVLVATGVLVLRDDPPVLDPAPGPATTNASAQPTPKAVQLELAEPEDHVTYVDLSWRSPEQLEFAVVIAEEGQENRTVRAQRNRTMRIEVDPSRKYCFLVQGTDGTQVYESSPKALHGAKCKI